MSPPTSVERRLEAERVRMRDGTHLAADVVLPEGDGPWPALLTRTPYGRVFALEDAPTLCSKGVAVVVQDCRGRFDSEGSFDLGASDVTDGGDTVAWVAAQPWCDGRVAMRGTSYPGVTQWKASLARPEGLIAIAPMMCPPWWGRMGFRHGGAIQLALAAHWLPLQAAWDPSTPDDLRERMAARAFDFAAVGDRVELDDVLKIPSLARLPLADPWPVEGSELYEEIWRRLFEPPTGPVSPLDDPGPALDERIAAPALVVGSWYDLWATGQVRAFAALSRDLPHRLVMSPHGHGFDLLRHFDPGPVALRFHLGTDAEWALEWLTEQDSTLRDLPAVTYFTLGANEWRHASAWPPPNTDRRRLYLAPTGLADRPPATAHSVSFDYDPRTPVPTRGGAGIGLPLGPHPQDGLTGGDRPDVLSFTGPPLTEPREITGEIAATLYAASTAPDTDLTVKLCDVAPDGTVLSICDGIVRARYRHGPEPVLLEPGRVERFGVHLGCVSYEVPAGHALRVDVSSSNFPRFDRNANTGAPEGSDGPGDLQVATQTIVSSADHPSFVEIPVVG